MTSYTELLEKKAALEKQAAELQKLLNEAHKAERAGVIAQITKLMAEHGLTVADLGGKPARVFKGGVGKGIKVAPKYRDPDSGATWTGRGLRPKWLTRALKEGKSAEDFAI